MKTSKIKIALIDDQAARSSMLKAQFENSRMDHTFQLYTCLNTQQLHNFDLQDLALDLLLFNMDIPHLEPLLFAIQRYEIATVLFTRNNDTQQIDSAIAAGINAYIVDEISWGQLDNTLKIAMAQHSHQQRLKAELQDAKTKLADRKDIEKAKNLLLHLNNVTEQQAFALLRKKAMDQRMSIGDMARRLLNAQQNLLHTHLGD